MSGDVTERDRKAAVVEREEVVDVSADIEPGRRFIDVAELDAVDLRIHPREQRSLHRVREALLLLVEPGVLERERGLAGDRERELEVALAERPARIERHQRDRAEHLRRR